MLAFQLPRDRRPIRLGAAAMAPPAPPIGVKRQLLITVAHTSRQGSTQLGAFPTFQRLANRAISRVGRQAENFNRMISCAWRIETLSAGIDRSLGFAKRSDLNRPAEGLVTVPDPGRDHSVTVGGIIS